MSHPVGIEANLHAILDSLGWSGDEHPVGIEANLHAILDETGEVIHKTDELEQNKADMIVSSASGSVASFPDGGDNQPVKDLTVGIDPVQDLHGYNNPWPAGGGVNLIPDGTDTDNGFIAGHYLKSDGTTTSSPGYNVSEYFSVSPDNTYTIAKHTDTAANVISFCFYDDSKQFISGEAMSNRTSFQVTPPSGAVYCRGTYDNPITPSPLKMTMSLGTDVPAVWTPYSNICPITGWMEVNLANISDSTKQPAFAGLMNGTYKFVDLGTLTWTYDGINNRFFATLSDMKYVLVRRSPLICSRYQTISDGRQLSDVPDKSIYNGDYRVYVHDSNYNNATKFKSAMSGAYLIYPLENPTTPTITSSEYSTLLSAFGLNGFLLNISWESEFGTVYGGHLIMHEDGTGDLVVDRAMIASYDGETLPGEWISDRDVYEAGITPTTGAQVVYELATPVSYTLTVPQVRTLLGVNNIWADTGNTEAAYRADTKLYIEQLTKPAEDDMTANANIAYGKFFMVGNSLFLSTAAIEQGAAIVPGTNCSEVSLADALNTLNT